MNFKLVNNKINKLIKSGKVNPNIGTAMKSVPVIIESVNEHAKTHGITLEQAQIFVNNSEIMFNQGNRNMYLSNDGSATVIIENKRLISAYGKELFNPGIIAILEVIENVRRK